MFIFLLDHQVFICICGANLHPDFPLFTSNNYAESSWRCIYYVSKFSESGLSWEWMHHKFSSFKNINTIHLIGAQCCHTVSVKQQLTLLTTFSMEAFRQAVTFGVSTAKSGPGQELLTLALTRSFPPKSSPERLSRNGTRDSCAEEGEVWMFVCSDSRVGSWLVSGSQPLWWRMWTAIFIQGSAIVVSEILIKTPMATFLEGYCNYDVNGNMWKKKHMLY